MEATSIYALVDPFTKHVRYIGKANVVHKRYYAHLVDSRKNHRSLWIRSVLATGARPHLLVLDNVPKAEWQFWEMHYISLYRSWGFDLTNKSQGGEGTEHTLETRKRISNTKKGKPVPHLIAFKKSERCAEIMKAIGLKRRGSKQSQETKDKRAKKHFKSVIQMDMLGNFLAEHESIKAASKAIGRYSICAALKNKEWSCGGYKWKYKNK